MSRKKRKTGMFFSPLSVFGLFVFFLLAVTPRLAEVYAEIHTAFHFYGSIITPQGGALVRPNMYVAMIDSARNGEGNLRRNKRYQLVGGNTCIYDLNSPLSAHEATVIDKFFPYAGMQPCPAEGQCIIDGNMQGCSPGASVCDDSRYHCDYPGWNMDNKFIFAAWQSLFVDWGQPRSNWVPPGGNQTVTVAWCNQGMNIPGVGSTEKIDKQVGCGYDSGGFGCNEDPVIFRGYIDGCICTDCIVEDFVNTTNGNGINDLAALCKDPSGNRVSGIVCTCANNPIITSVVAQDICEGQSSSIYIEGQDEDGSGDIQRFVLNINQGGGTIAQFEIVDGGSYWKNFGSQNMSLQDCDSYTPGDQYWCELTAQKKVVIKPSISGLTSGSYVAQAVIYDYASNSGSGQDAFSVSLGPTGDVTIDGEYYKTISEGDDIELDWWASNATSCSLTTDPSGTLGGNSSSCDYTRTLSPSPGTYTATFDISNGCGPITPSPSATVVVEAAADPWSMTAKGDTYASGGYDDDMYNVTSYDVLKGSYGEARFSTYIISNKSPAWPGPDDDSRSHRKYILGNYDDKNIEKVGASKKIYHYLLDLVSNNDV
ncbi:MAG: hypothetical protein PHS44_08245, partial [Candidatus Dojkabacteria bacterium]|nr:hypothetical protein [Candidatus Dojkabacteria bacterium]